MLFLQVCRQSCSKEIRERVCSCNQTWAKSNENLRAKFERVLRGSEWMRVECESSTPTPRPLFKGRMAGHHWEELGTTTSSHWRKLTESRCQVGSADPGVRPAPLWAHWLTARAQVLPNGNKLWTLWCRAKLCLERFSKDFNAQKIFLFFYKNRKGARKDSSMHWCFENSNMQWENFQKSRKANLVEN